MKELTTVFAGMFAATLLAAAPTVSDVTMTQNVSTREVTITYRLSSVPAIVTLDIETNCVVDAQERWASIGAENIMNVAGDAFVRVSEPKDAYSISWHPEASWPGFKIPSGGARAVVVAHDLCDGPRYMAIDLAAAGQRVHYYPSATAVPGGVTNDLYKTSSILLRRVDARNVTFPMGSFYEGGGANETQHTALLTNDYYLGVYPVTQSQWQRVTGSNPSRWKVQGAMRPVELVSYARVRTASNDAYSGAYDYPNAPHCDSFLGKLNTLTDNLLGLDLPSEAQWEYAAKAGNVDGFFGRSDSPIPMKSDGTINPAEAIPIANTIGRYKRNGGQDNWATPGENVGPDKGTAIVGTYLPNDWGFYDMLGNVAEWCVDWYQVDITALNGQPNVNGAQSLDAVAGSDKVVRGSNASGCECEYNNMRPAYRGNLSATSTPTWQHNGLRIVASGCEKANP
ncbi:MAG: formylglycine-generating enzyme family protein [Kiritimatiellae bacterium]|nr:formylglycine-generating enzyme family protein [Kiritimatiellia bacterium]